MTRTPFVSEAPVLCEIVPAGDEAWGLERRLDPSFARVPAAFAAFLAEVEAAAAQKAGGTGLAVVLEATAGSEPRLVREYRPEGTLRDLIWAGRPIPIERAIAIVSGVADALDSLHRLGVFHGDPSPENVLLRAEGGVALADPRSSRRVLGMGGAAPADSHRGDREVLLPLARRLVSLGEGSADSPLRREAVSILDCPWEPERKISSLQRLAGPAPVPFAPVERRVRPPIPFPVPVLVSVAAIDDPRVRYAAAKVCAPAAGLTPARAARMLETGAVSFESAFPSPARALADALKASGARVSILSPGRAPATVRPREE